MTLPEVPSLWHRENPEDPVPGAEFPDRTQVAVIGAGLAGVSAALHLAQRGVDVTVLEAEDQVAPRASGRNAGFLLAGVTEYYDRFEATVGRDMARSVLDFSIANREGVKRAVANEGIACSLQARGVLYAAGTEPELASLAATHELLTDMGYESRMLTAAEAAEVLGSDRFLGGRVDPGDGILDPVRLVRGLALAAVRRGARFVKGARVLGLQERSDGDLALATSHGELRADMAVVASNAYTPQVLPMPERWLFPVRGQCLWTEPVDRPLFDGMGCITHFEYEYFRQAPGGQVVLGGMRWSVPEMECGIAHEGLNPDLHRNLSGWLAEHFPELAGLQVQGGWTGIMGHTADGLALVGPAPGKPRVIMLCGFTSRGYSFAWHAAECVAASIAGETPPSDTRWFRPSRMLGR